MKQDIYTHYVIEAMRLFAAQGKPSAAELRNRRSGATPAQLPGILDMTAVRAAYDRISHEPNGEFLARCVDLIYFSHPQNLLTRNSITQRIQGAVFDLGASESTIYRALKRMRYLVAEERGLRRD